MGRVPPGGCARSSVPRVGGGGVSVGGLGLLRLGGGGGSRRGPGVLRGDSGVPLGVGVPTGGRGVVGGCPAAPSAGGRERRSGCSLSLSPGTAEVSAQAGQN